MKCELCFQNERERTLSLFSDAISEMGSDEELKKEIISMLIYHLVSREINRALEKNITKSLKSSLINLGKS